MPKGGTVHRLQFLLPLLINVRAWSRGDLSSLRDSFLFVFVTQGLRPGLTYAAPSGLPTEDTHEGRPGRYHGNVDLAI